jgi:hypothetical protein
MKQRRIVCAACRAHYDGQVVLGVRHFDRLMLQGARTNASFSAGYPHEDGFIDNHGVFLTRTEAWKVAEAAGQIIYRVGGDEKDGGTLFSENMY